MYLKRKRHGQEEKNLWIKKKRKNAKKKERKKNIFKKRLQIGRYSFFSKNETSKEREKERKKKVKCIWEKKQEEKDISS